jgi:hypothetical protein
MDSHLALLTRLHDYEQRESEQDIVRLADGNEHHEEMDLVEASAEAEVEIDDVNIGVGADVGHENGENKKRVGEGGDIATDNDEK